MNTSITKLTLVILVANPRNILSMANRDGKHAVSEARVLTATLTRIRKNMHSNVLQADSAVAALLKDGAEIADTYDEHKHKLKDALNTTKIRLNRVKAAEQNEKYYIFFSIAFFTCVVAYIILRRTRIVMVIMLSISSALWAHENINKATTTYLNQHRADQNRPSPILTDEAVDHGAVILTHICEKVSEETTATNSNNILVTEDIDIGDKVDDEVSIIVLGEGARNEL